MRNKKRTETPMTVRSKIRVYRANKTVQGTVRAAASGGEGSQLLASQAAARP